MPSRLPSWRSRRPVSRSPEGRRTSSAVEVLVQRAHALAVGRVALVVAPAALERARVGRAVDVVDARADGRQAAGHERLAQALGGDRQVGHDAQPAEALARARSSARRPARGGCARRRARSRRRGSARAARPARPAVSPGSVPIGRRAPGAALVEHEHAELGQRAVQPAGRARVAGGARRLAARPALQEDEQRAVAPVGVGDLAREDRDASRRRRRRGRAGPRTRAR